MNRKEFKAINVSDLQKLAETKSLQSIDVQTLFENGLCSKGDNVKILGNGKLTLKLEVKAHAFSKTAIEAIEKLEGSVVTL